MAATTESVQRSPFTDPFASTGPRKSIPILPSSSSTNSPLPAASDPMDITPSSTTSTTSTTTMGPPQMSSPTTDRPPNASATNGEYEPTSNGTSAPAVGAAAATQQPKVVQTAFIHKLYNMLEDPSIQHLISWSSTNDSFVMSPSTEFSRVLSSYFKHTNISSFVRQLNMYGFHKVSDVFHTGQPDSPLWEFKHGNGNFKRGDLVGLREIKRRASRHALIHRDSFSAAPKPPVPPPQGTILEASGAPDPIEARLAMLEHHYFDLHARLARAEDTAAFLNTKCTFLAEGLLRCHQWNQDLATYLMAIVPNPDDQIHKDVAMMQREIARQTDMLRSFDEPQEPLSAGRASYLATAQDNGAPLSPRQVPVNDQRRPSQPSLLPEARTPFRTPHAPHLSISPRRYGSIGSGSNTYSPSSARAPSHLAPPPPPPPPPPMQHPLATVTSPPTNLPRRHTSADIRLHGWQPGQSALDQTPSASGQNSSQWPSSPHRTPLGGDQELRNALAQYELPRGPSSTQTSRQPSPPQPPHVAESGGAQTDAGWQLPGARFSFKGVADSGPPTRRSSLASNVHSLLNPIAAGDEEEVDPVSSKRKRVQ
ncbi:uncharacterized protein PV09_01119 [Verruconis gallopava]|uniref:HSF-type DNA-binding domain-containing protein n=1 Tax=Verruconis gallopava TaxID=253628 RepID=A0A0D2AN79_9PEZI|nr:uncharacterized protein PV09_01119 [Verruconis gallopava]KIW08188.1 hypothetical protein PV09_01119 [Verruconis gallopava]